MRPRSGPPIWRRCAPWKPTGRRSSSTRCASTRVWCSTKACRRRTCTPLQGKQSNKKSRWGAPAAFFSLNQAALRPPTSEGGLYASGEHAGVASSRVFLAEAGVQCGALGHGVSHAQANAVHVLASVNLRRGQAGRQGQSGSQGNVDTERVLVGLGAHFRLDLTVASQQLDNAEVVGTVHAGELGSHIIRRHGSHSVVHLVLVAKANIDRAVFILGVEGHHFVLGTVQRETRCATETPKRRRSVIDVGARE